jgi:predicted nucleic acid-binding Zn ribbon protein
METLRRFCLECGKRIVGRADKKFCDDACRNDFNNKQNSEANKTMKNINYALRKNRRILLSLNPSGKTKISKQQLQKAGFDFKYMTHVFTSNSGDTYYFCYEQAYVPLENNYFALVVDQDYAS